MTIEMAILAILASECCGSLMSRFRVKDIDLRSLHTNFEGPTSMHSKDIAFFVVNYLIGRLVGWLGWLE